MLYSGFVHATKAILVLRRTGKTELDAWGVAKIVLEYFPEYGSRR